jgi:hypothetical protein
MAGKKHKRGPHTPPSSTVEAAPAIRSENKLWVRTAIVSIISFIVGHFAPSFTDLRQWWNPHFVGSVNGMMVTAKMSYFSLSPNGWVRTQLDPGTFTLLIRLTNNAPEKLQVVGYDLLLSNGWKQPLLAMGRAFFVEFDFPNTPQPSYVDFSEISCGALTASKQLDPGESMTCWALMPWSKALPPESTSRSGSFFGLIYSWAKSKLWRASPANTLVVYDTLGGISYIPALTGASLNGNVDFFQQWKGHVMPQGWKPP